MYSNLKTYLILFGGVFALSTSAIFVKIADAPSSVTAFYRLLLAAAALTPVFLLSAQSRAEIKVIRKAQWGQIISAGAFLALHYVLWFESLNFTSVASSTVLVCLQPLFSLALERFVSKQRVRAAALTGCVIALCGSVIIGAGDFQISGKSLLGDVLAFIAARCNIHVLFCGRKGQKVYLCRYILHLELLFQRSYPARLYRSPARGSLWLCRPDVACFCGIGVDLHHRRTICVQSPVETRSRLCRDHEYSR